MSIDIKTGAKSKPRVLVLLPYGVGNHYGGPTISTYRLFKDIRKMDGFIIDLVHASSLQKKEIDLFDKVIGMPFVDNEDARGPALKSKIKLLLYSIFWMLFNSRKYDVIYTPMTNVLTLVPCWVAKIMGTPVIGRVAAAETELKDKGYLQRTLRFSKIKGALLNRFSLVIALSEEISTRMVELGVSQKKILRLPNAADCDRFRPATLAEIDSHQRELSLPEEGAKFFIACVGALCERKGQHLIIEALASLPSEVHCVFAGPDRPVGQKELLKSQAKKLNVEGRVHFVGHIENIEKVYMASQIFILPSSNEGMPNAMVEAMACGLPAIGTRVSGIPELIGENERGILVCRTAQDITRAVSEYYNNPEKLKDHGSFARKYIVSNQSNEVVANKLSQAILSLSADVE